MKIICTTDLTVTFDLILRLGNVMCFATKTHQAETKTHSKFLKHYFPRVSLIWLIYQDMLRMLFLIIFTTVESKVKASWDKEPAPRHWEKSNLAWTSYNSRELLKPPG